MGRRGEGRGGRRSRAEGRRGETAAAGGEGVGEVDDLQEDEGGMVGSRGEECGERGEGGGGERDRGRREGEHRFHLDQTALK